MAELKGPTIQLTTELASRKITRSFDLVNNDHSILLFLENDILTQAEE